ncbi:hypothetical protein LCGC14_2196960, partial [marine sediment metagenome]
LGETAEVMWLEPDAVIVQFPDGDERALFFGECEGIAP